MPAKKVDPEPLQAARQAWRMVLVLHARLVAEAEREAADAGVIPLIWFDVLVTLNLTPGNRMRLRDLAEAVLLTRAGLSRLLDRIEAKGLLRREACADDGRGAEAVLTEAGRVALKQAWPVFGRVIDQRWAAHLPRPEQTAGALRQVLLANDWLPELVPVQVTLPPARKPRTTR